VARRPRGGWVAVADAQRDYLSEDEVALIDSGLDYLDPVWTSDDWTLYRVADPVPIGADVSGPDRFEVEAEATGELAPALNYNRYWDGEGGCVRDADGRTVVEAEAPGRLEFGVSLSGARC